MTRIHSRTVTWSALVGALGVAALLGAAPSASAEPAAPAPPAPVLPVPAPAPAVPAPVAAPLAAPVPAPVPLDQPLPVPTEIQHLASPENLPPGATLAPTEVNQGRGVSYLRELWHAVQTQEVSKSGALLLLTQRPMNPDAPAGQPAGPQAPLPPAPLPAPPVVP